MTQRTILVVEEDLALLHMIAATLRGEGHIVFAVTDGAATMEIVQYNPLSLILLDLTHAPSDVLDICHHLRLRPETVNVPILLLVDHEDEIGQVARHIPSVNDYIVKPLKTEELRACVRALLRLDRHSSKRRSPKVLPGVRMGGTNKQDVVLVADELQIDMLRRRVMRRGEVIELSRALMFELLVYLAQHPGIVFTREQLLREIWGYGSADTNDTRTVDVHVRWLREKLEDEPDNPQLIQTVRGVGYRFRD